MEGQTYGLRSERDAQRRTTGQRTEGRMESRMGGQLTGVNIQGQTTLRRTREVVLRDEVNVKDCEERPVRIEEVVTRVYEKPVVEEHIRHVQKVVEVERRVPQYEIIEKEVEIENDTPRVVKKYVDVPQVVEETVIVPSKQKKIVELNPVIEKVVPRMQHRVIEKQIERTKIIEVLKPVVVEKKQPIPGPQSQADVPVVVSHVMLPPVVRQAGTVEVPVTRIVPKIQYVDIIIPNRSISEEELTAKIQAQVQYRLVQQSYRPITHSIETLKNGESVMISSHRQEDDVQVEVKSGPGASEDPNATNANGLYIDFQHTRAEGQFSAADYNSWLLVLNEHLKEPASLGFTSGDQGELKAQLVNALPFIRGADGTVTFLQPGVPMDGEIMPSRGRHLPEEMMMTRRPMNGTVY